jgi:tRNA(His) 5'-end guanylyltransferase
MPDDLCDRMKFYETYSENYIHSIDPFTNFVIRLDGNGFSKILNNIKADEIFNLRTPYVNDFKTAMDKTTVDLVKKFNGTTGFNHSDEISIMFKPLNKDNDDEFIKEHIYNGRIVKLLTLMSSYATIRLQKHLRDLNSARFHDAVDRITFDGRHIIFPNKNELINYFIWRSKIVCYGSFVKEIAATRYTKKSIVNCSTSKIVEKLKNEYNNDIDDYNVFLRNGTYVKRKLVQHEKDGKIYWYNDYIRFALPNIKCETSYYDLFDCKNFQEWEFQDIDFELLGKF